MRIGEKRILRMMSDKLDTEIRLEKELVGAKRKLAEDVDVRRVKKSRK